MVNAVVLLSCGRNSINRVAESLSAMDGVTEVYSVAGQFDLVAMVRARDNDSLADLITSGMLKVDGIERSETLIAFRVYSPYDLENMFSIGMKD